ncbi:TonB-dependent vitamin B12 receptor [Duganella sp. Leaf126]|uniref:TonB-dependent receptor domain-containing protein n=1 Tax=Duganella sp. Leaf126 TaxID=1736266 RepID=UPI0006F9EBEB|nr:TonB-dependent receptor [Duganella sp. Leaf126]KQQ42419.1 TonB-dependent vitamin B12 receptor [Duganella sp. Leaf126]
MIVRFIRHPALAVVLAAACHAHAEPASTVLVTATRSPQALADVISDSTTIDAAQIARTGAGSIVDLLQRQRGIEVTRNGGAGSAASVYLRGANSNQSIVLVDGVRIGSSTTGAANWSAIPLTAIDRIEIVYGPLSALYGADAIGGVIQIFTKQGQGAPAVTGFAGYGSNNTRKADATVSGATDGAHSLRYALSAGKETSHGFSSTRPGLSSYNPDDDGYDRQNVAGHFGLQLAEGVHAGLVLLHSRLQADYDTGPSAYNTHSISSIATAGVFVSAQLLPTWRTLLQTAQTRDNSANYTSATAAGNTRIDTRQHFTTWQNDVQVGADLLQLLVEHRTEHVDTNGAPAMNRDRVTKAFAASYNARRGAHLLSASARRDDAVYGKQYTGAIGYGYQLARALRASASYGSSFRAPTYNELYFPNYGNAANRPEKGRNAEVGLRYDDGVNAVSASYYRNRLSDMLVNTTPCPFGAGYTGGCAYNVSRATLAGATLAGATRVKDVRLGVSADLQHPQDDSTGKRLIRRARRHATVSADYDAGAANAGVEVQLSGARFDNAANTSRLGGYGLVNLYATHALTRDWSALLRWNNVANKRYELARYYNTPGATLFVGLRFGVNLTGGAQQEAPWH